MQPRLRALPRPLLGSDHRERTHFSHGDDFPKFFDTSYLAIERKTLMASESQARSLHLLRVEERVKLKSSLPFPHCMCPSTAEPHSHLYSLYIWFRSLEMSSLLIASLPSGTSFLIPAQKNDLGPQDLARNVPTASSPSQTSRWDFEVITSA